MPARLDGRVSELSVFRGYIFGLYLTLYKEKAGKVDLDCIALYEHHVDVIVLL